VSPPDRVLLRSQLYLRVLLPLVEEVAAADPGLRASLAGERASVQFQTADGLHGARLLFGPGGVSVVQGVDPGATVRLRFRGLAALDDFFAGKAALPAVDGLRHPLLLARALRLLSSLQILRPGAGASALRVRMVLLLVTRGLVQLHRGGFEPLVDLVSDSPERVYQWSVGPGLAAHLRMEKGKIEAGQGVYPHRRPFVHFVFPDVAAAAAVFDATESQMGAVRRGLVTTEGSPEYTRRISILMQQLDELLVEG